MKPKDYYNLSNLQRDTLVTLGDEMLIHPVSGKRKKICLNRTKMTLETSDCFTVEEVGCSIKLEDYLNENRKMEIVLLDERSPRPVMIARSGNHPLKINGNYCFEAILQYGDIILFGHNKLQFIKKLGNENYSEISSNENEEIFKTDMNILLEGETGTGKSTLARKIHKASGLLGDFVQVNLSAFSENLIESEIFGHVKGAFTGAIGDKSGAIEKAQNGTLFIDEIDSLPKNLQIKLLLFLDNKDFSPVGSLRKKSSNARLIFSTGSSLKEKVESQQMRPDFFFRISSGYKIKLNPLRDNKVQVRNLIQKFENSYGVVVERKLSQYLEGYRWPGNIRQLNGHLLKKYHLRKSNVLKFEKEDLELEHSLDLCEDYIQEKLFSLKELKEVYCKNVFQKLGCDFKASLKVLDVAPNTLKRHLEELAT